MHMPDTGETSGVSSQESLTVIKSLTGGLDGLLGIKASGVWDVKGSQKVVKVWSLHIPHGWMQARARTETEQNQ